MGRMAASGISYPPEGGPFGAQEKGSCGKRPSGMPWGSPKVLRIMWRVPIGKTKNGPEKPIRYAVHMQRERLHLRACILDFGKEVFDLHLKSLGDFFECSDRTALKKSIFTRSYKRLSAYSRLHCKISKSFSLLFHQLFDVTDDHQATPLDMPV